MTDKTLFHSIILICAVFLTFSWVTNSELVNYSLQLSGILMLVLIISRHILKPTSFRLAESTLSTVAVLLIANATGGTSSPLFFLNYFLLFEMSLLLEPVISLILSFLLISFYLTTHNSDTSLFQLVELLAFPLMTPLAIFFGKIYIKEENQKREIRNLSKKVKELEEEIIEEKLVK